MVERLSDFPWVLSGLIVPCALTARVSIGSLVWLEKFGADIQLCDLLDRIAFDCPRKTLPWERPRWSVRSPMQGPVHRP